MRRRISTATPELLSAADSPWQTGQRSSRAMRKTSGERSGGGPSWAKAGSQRESKSKSSLMA
jgi:hypothetical protein